jgi:erythronate-4-phosphate dehydrogenase
VLIVVDQEITGAAEVFSGFGEVRAVQGRGLRPEDMAGADALIVRSVTRVDAALLAGSRVGFVGSATSGTDHVDIAWLASQGIAFASAAGCNAVTVAEYVLTAVLLLARHYGFDPASKTIGIIGVGRIGSVVARWAEALGMAVLKCDPPLQRLTGGGGYVGFAELAEAADVVTLHVPLTGQGPDATADMVDCSWLTSLRPGTMLINTSRGEVVREDHLLEVMGSGRLGPVVLDVWRGEPRLNPRLARIADVATPHIAGYSVEARVRAVRLIAGALARFTGLVPPAAPPPLVDSALTDIRVALTEKWYVSAGEALARACPIVETAEALRGSLGEAHADDPAEAFDRLRSIAAHRREFSGYRVLGVPRSSSLDHFLRVLGFATTSP